MAQRPAAHKAGLYIEIEVEKPPRFWSNVGVVFYRLVLRFRLVT